MTTTVLLADDDPVQRRLTEAALRRLGYQPLCVENGDQALQAIEKSEANNEPISAIILDLVMPGLDGFGVMERLRFKNTACPPILVQTGQGSLDTVVSAMRMGAIDFLVKPVSPERLQVSLSNALKVAALESEVTSIKNTSSGNFSFRDLVSTSPEMMAAVRLGERAAQSGIPVLLEGESGVGKEVFARAMQGASERKSRPFITVNCGALPINLIESILFGHEKGAFTGATEKHIGKFIEADGGTLFLDEVGELPLEAQTRLLRVLQEGEVDPVGAKKTVRVDVRIISATNRDLLKAVREGKFREDLYYRLAVFPITIPRLARRKTDIPMLARRFIARFAAEEGKGTKGISAEALNLLMNYDWPGNVRELENCLFRAVVLSDHPDIIAADLPNLSHLSEHDRIETKQNPFRDEQTATQNAPELSRPNMLLLDKQGHVRSLQDIESESIRFALMHYNHQMSEVARRLGIGRSTLYRKLEEMGIAAEHVA